MVTLLNASSMMAYNVSTSTTTTENSTIVRTPDSTLSSFVNTVDYSDVEEDEFIFDRTYVKVIFITLYTIVFCLCFFGNLLVILVVTLSRRLRSITNFFLANLAVADLCVGIFCVFQNLSIYLVTNWILGDFLCKMYQFVNTLSYTASIFILVVICTERYFAIIHPITCKQILTPTRLRLVILAVWITSALYSAPKFFWVNTITTSIGSKNETVCIANRKKFNSQLFDMINFVFLYAIPLAIMTLLYTRIAVGLWRSSRKLEKQLNAGANGLHQGISARQSMRMKFIDKKNQQEESKMSQCGTVPYSSSSQNVLKARRGVIRMLIIVVLTFALCNLPFHARKMWQYWSHHYHGDTNFSALFTPLTFLVTYFNSGINPLLYAFLSKNFRRGMREVLFCTFSRNRREQSQRLHYAVGFHQRQASTRSTIKGHQTNTTVTVINYDASSECSHDV